MPGWLDDVLTSEAFYVLLGAFIGYGASHLHDWQKAKAVRRGLGALLHGELVSMSPPDDPITRDPDQAWRLYLRSIPLLLAPGVLDPDKDTDLIMELIFLASVIDTRNERARLFDEASARGESPQTMQQLYNALQGSHWDYQRAHANMMAMLWLLGPPMPLYNRVAYKPDTLRDRFDYWRTSKTRQAWNELNAANSTDDLATPTEKG